tara:strand:- start:7388 stop:7912 length:525 start_codon:yes stop_codon:yes gene_type:complete
MKSEKTTAAIRLARKYGKYYNVVVINPIIDIRTSDGLSKSRNGIAIDCINVKLLKDLMNDNRFLEADIVVIDEAQFFEDLDSFVKEWLSKKNFIISSLDADANQEKFGKVWNLIPIATKVKKFCALCELCENGNRAVATIVNPKYKDKRQDQINVVDGNSDYYLPVCFIHSQKN